MKFLACMFDYDGTITEKGLKVPSQKMADILLGLSKKMPFAFCTGRDLPSFKEKALSNLLNEIDKSEHENFLSSLHLMAENGSIGYHYNPVKRDFEQFYQVCWPNDYVDRSKLFDLIDNDADIKKYGSTFKTRHKNVLVVRAKSYETDRVEDIYKEAKAVYDACYRILSDFDAHFEKYLHIGNAGIGVVICPADGDKDSAIKAFGDYLSSTRGFSFSDNYREIMVIGDQPQYGGNDYYFLNGRYGTPYNVGEWLSDASNLNDVYDKNGERLMHSKATEKLLSSVLK